MPYSFLIITIRFTCGDMNILSNMKMSQNVMARIVVSVLLVIARCTQSTQNSKFVISLQYLKKEGMDEVDFVHADKHQTNLQVILLILVGMTRKFVISLQNPK